MAKQTLQFFATSDDLRAVLARLATVAPVEYWSFGLSKESDRETGPTSSADLVLEARYGDTNLERAYLVVPQGYEPIVQEVPQRRGGVMLAVDQLLNPSSIVLVPGGVFEDRTIIAGRVGTVSTDEASTRLFRAVSTEIRRQWRAHGAYRIGPKADDLLQQGWRLTSSVKSPKQYDLAK